MGKKKNKSQGTKGIPDELVGVLLSKGEKLLSSGKIQEALFGTYSNGKPRNLIDALNGEVLSPKQKRNMKYKKKKVKNKKIKL